MGMETKNSTEANSFLPYLCHASDDNGELLEKYEAYSVFKSFDEYLIYFVFQKVTKNPS